MKKEVKDNNKKSKTIKIVLAIVIVLVVGGLITFLCLKDKNKKTYTITNDSLNFKTEYESLNGQKTDSGKTYLTINIKSYNPMKYSSYKEIFKVLDKGTGVIYFGFPECPWCRNLVPVLVDSALDNDIDTIYYLNIRDDRDIKELTSKGKIKTTKEATENYTKLVEKLYKYLPTYEGLKDDTIKRVYLPTVVFVKNGKILGLEQSLEAFSKRVGDNPYQSMTKKEKEELSNTFKKYYEKLN
jgi:thiol-disulfide isomerase/thioredoxin